MASGTRTITGLGNVFDFTTERRGTVSFFSNDLNISFNVTANSLRLHTGPILFLTTAQVGGGARVQATAVSIGSGFPPPPLSLLQLQTDTIAQTPTGEIGDPSPAPSGQ